MIFLTALFVQLLVIVSTDAKGYRSSALDHNLHEKVLDPQQCEKQLEYIISDGRQLRAQFMDASVRTPRGILLNNYRDMGNYYQCLDIRNYADNMQVEGKYCVINIPIPHDLDTISLPGIGPGFPWTNHRDWDNYFNRRTSEGQSLESLQQYELGKENVMFLLGTAEVSSGYGVIIIYLFLFNLI
ncbi:unnamed protein product [Diatraea saccharalis]|uniref:Nose resistant-to-fluoxetine protein N-terminal domain-containing protein n=1 Tax=Diatraea saccharalis TaxID=40085 RepID=A0A9N9QY56_9NEOP|nr:unnamed protein product [Diatraea saccharalis]